jgi:hypothetical protein
MSMQPTPDATSSPRPARATRRSLAEITRELEALRAMTSRELAKKYQQLVGAPTRSNNRNYLLRQIAWRLQDDAGHFEAIRARIQKLSPSVDVPVRWQQKAAQAAGLAAVEVPAAKAPPAAETPQERDPRLPAAGTVLLREYEGRRHEVVVRADGFTHDGKHYARLTQIAHAITGRKWNGFEFFKVALATAARARAA